MKRFERSHLTSPGLLSLAATHLAQDRNTTADLLADMAEIEKRRLYAPAGYDSMYMFCVHAWGISEDVACNRIRAARELLGLEPPDRLVTPGRVDDRFTVRVGGYRTVIDVLHVRRLDKGVRQPAPFRGSCSVSHF